MGSRTAHNSRPEIQARKIAALNNPEWVRRNKLYRESTGYKRERVVLWNLDWNRKGRPADHPDFPEWDAVNKPKLDEERRQQRAADRNAAAFYALHVAPHYQVMCMYWEQVFWQDGR